MTFQWVSLVTLLRKLIETQFLEKIENILNFKMIFLHDKIIFFIQIFSTIWNFCILSIYHATSTRGGAPETQLRIISKSVFFSHHPVTIAPPTSPETLSFPSDTG